VNDDRKRERLWGWLVLLNIGVLIVGLVVGLAAHHKNESRIGPNRSTFERETPNIDNWPRHRRPFPRG
jgi:hypothetical protein